MEAQDFPVDKGREALQVPRAALVRKPLIVLYTRHVSRLLIGSFLDNLKEFIFPSPKIKLCFLCVVDLQNSKSKFIALILILKYVYSFRFYVLQGEQETLVHQVRAEDLESAEDLVHPEAAGPPERQDEPDPGVVLENEERLARMDLQGAQDFQDLADPEAQLDHLENPEHQEDLDSQEIKVAEDHQENQDYPENKGDQVSSLPFCTIFKICVVSIIYVMTFVQTR